MADSRFKTCPCCGAVLFADMDVCYGCLHDFSRKPLPPRLPLLETPAEADDANADKEAGDSAAINDSEADIASDAKVIEVHAKQVVLVVKP